MFINDLFNDKDKTLNEVSNELLGRYKKAAGADASAADKRGDVERGNKRFSGIVNATKKEFANDLKKHKKSNVDEQAPQYTPKGIPLPTKQPTQQQPLNVPQGWEAKTQPDGSTRISKIGSMSSADYKQSMADYKAKNWTPEKMADYSQRMASGQGYTDAERQANLQQQQQHFGKYADTGDLKETEPTTNQPRTTMSDERKAQLRKDINAVDYNKEQQPLAAPSPEQKASIRQAVSDYNKEKVKEQDDFPNEKTLKQQEQDRWSHYDAAKKAAQGEILGREVDGKVISIPPGHPEYDETFDDLYRQQNPGYPTPNDPGFYLTPYRYPGEPEPAYTKALVEGGPFSYGAKKPRRGSVADLAAKKRKEQEKGKQPAEPKDHMVGVARVTKGVTESGHGRNRGYEPGFASPHAPSLGGRRERDEPDAVNNIEISINGRVWKIFAGKGPDRSREFFQQKQAVDAMCKRKTAETGKEWSWGVTGAAATNEGTKCNMTEEGRSCPAHGIMECPGYSRLMGEAFKMPPESVQDKMHRRHQELRKKSGLPDPEHYLKLKKQKEQELAALRAEIEQDRAKGLDEAEERYLEELQRAGYDIITEKKIRQRLDPKCWKGKHKEGTKIKGGVRVNNCVPNK